MIHSEAARKWNNEQRKRKLYRLYYHAMDVAGLWLWCMVGVMVSACVMFILLHK